MAKFYITEYVEIAQTYGGGRSSQVPMEPPVAEQTVTFSGATQSAAFNAETRLVRIETDSICSVLFGTNPTATTSSGRMAAGQTEFRAVPPKRSMKVSVISNT